VLYTEYDLACMFKIMSIRKKSLAYIRYIKLIVCRGGSGKGITGKGWVTGEQIYILIGERHIYTAETGKPRRMRHVQKIKRGLPTDLSAC
jgi:hypothetical protein